MHFATWLRNGQRLIAVLATLVVLWAIAVAGPLVMAGSSSLVVTKMASVSTVSPNDSITYSAVFSNPTGTDVVLTQITDSLPSGFRFVGMVPTSDITRTSIPPLATGVITWAGPVTVSAGGTIRVDYYVLASENAQASPYTNTVQAQTQGGDVTVVATAPVTVAAPNIVVAKVVTPSEIIEQNLVTYTVFISNTGNAVGTITATEDLLPAGFAFDRTIYPAWWQSYLGQTGLIKWNNTFTVAAGGVYTLSYRVTTGDASTSPYVNTVTATLDTGETPHGQVAVTVKPAVYLAYLPLIRKSPPPPPADILVFDAKESSSADWEIYTIKADGTELTPLTANTIGDWDPAWSGDGKKVIFVTYRDGNDEIYTMDAADGGNQRDISNNPLYDDEPDWSPLNDQVVYRSKRNTKYGGAYSDLVAANPDGTGWQNITYSDDPYKEREDWDPHYAPDGQHIVYVGGLTFYADIWIANADGSGKYQLTNNQPKHDRAPSWSPDGSKVAYISGDWDGPNNRMKPNTSEIWIVSADGSSRTQLTNNSADDLSPAWSPDGSKIVFSSNRGGHYDIWTMSADGTNPQQLTDVAGGNYVPRYSPDGSKIAFVSRQDGEKRLYVMNENGTGQQKVSGTLIDVVEFAWIPQGGVSTGQSSLLGTFGFPSSLADVATAEYWLSKIPQ